MSHAARNPDLQGKTPLIVERVVDFARFARDNGFRIGVGESLDALKVAEYATVLDKRLLRFGLRSLFCTDKNDWQRFDEVFDAYWAKTPVKGETALEGRRGRRRTEGGDEEADTADGAGAGTAPQAGRDGRRGGASRVESTVQKDFRYFSDPEEKRELEQLIERLASRMRYRLSRRQRFHQRGKVIDLRRTIRANLKHGGNPVRLMKRRRRPQPVKPVLLLDASGSMNLYSQFFLRFIYGILKSFKRADAFIFHTRLVHVKQVLLERNPATAMAKLGLISSGWAGGTRIGECLETFNTHYGRLTLNSRAVVIILSDGLDTGTPEALATQLKQMRQRAKRILWLNPLLGRAGYQPVAKGMAAALPWIDLFASAHNLESLAALEPQLVNL